MDPLRFYFLHEVFRFGFIVEVIYLGTRLLDYAWEFRLVLHGGLNVWFDLQLELIGFLVVLFGLRLAYTSQFDIILIGSNGINPTSIIIQLIPLLGDPCKVQIIRLILDLVLGGIWLHIKHLGFVHIHEVTLHKLLFHTVLPRFWIAHYA